MKLLDYLFYRIYSFYKRKRDSTPVFMAFAVITILVTFNCYDIIVIISLLKKETVHIPDYWVWLFMIIPMLLCLFRWRNEHTIEMILRKYSAYESSVHVKRGYVIILYILVSFLIPILYALLKHNLGMDI